MKFKKTYFAVGLVSFFAVLIVSSSFKVSAENELPCDSSDAASAITKVEPGDYQVYAKLGTTAPEERTTVAIRALSDEESQCIVVGSGLANKDSFVSIGTSNLSDSDAWEVFLQSSSTTSSQTAGGPSVVFAPNNGLCNFNQGCSVTYKGEPFNLSPR